MSNERTLFEDIPVVRPKPLSLAISAVIAAPAATARRRLASRSIVNATAATPSASMWPMPANSRIGSGFHAYQITRS